MAVRALALLLAAGALVLPQRRATVPSGDLVELDVVVVDRTGQPVQALRREDFEVKEDGKVVDLKTFDEVSILGTKPADDAQSVILLLDDIGIARPGTSPIRNLARILLAPARAADDVAVVRLSRTPDEPFGDLLSATDRIDHYSGGAAPFNPRDARESALEAVARISRALDVVEHRRKVLVCVGVRVVCDMEEPRGGRASPLWSRWVDALSSAAHANLAVYSLDLSGVNQRTGLRGLDLVLMTGGDLYSNSRDFETALRAIWWEASRYYLLGYWPSPKIAELHSIDAKVKRPDVQVRARQRR